MSDPRQLATLPGSLDELRRWIRDVLDAPEDQKSVLETAMGGVWDHQRQLWEASKSEAVQALSAGFADRLSVLQSELLAKDATVRSITTYFEDIVAELTEKANRDPKTRLMNFDWFMQRLESFLAIEQRVPWCVVGIVDIASFKWFNDNLGHATGDRIIERVAHLLADRLRSRDLLTKEGGGPHDLHARFGGDEFAFLVPDVPGPREACKIARRFKQHVESYAWHQEHPGLAERPVRVDVGIVCLELGRLDERRGAARKLAQELIDRADQLMYDSKADPTGEVHLTVAEVVSGRLVETRRIGPCRECQA